ncbi:MAG: hypothetical protein V7765_07890 [Oleispira sp.]
MKTIIKSAVLFSAVSLLAACGGDDTTTNQSASQNYHNIQTTLQGSIFNAIDGTRITDESLKVTLVQGSNYRNANVRRGSADFAGDYSIGNIPTSSNGGNITYRIVSSVDGFQPFEATFAFNVTTTGSLQDNNANRVGNIYMYPIGSFANDVKVNVTYNSEPVANATVLLNPQTVSNAPTTDVSNTLFPAQNGFQGAQTVVTDAAGIATFAAANLVLGGQYNISVLPTIHENTQLALPTASVFVVGTTPNIVNIPMTDSVPSAAAKNGLYVTSLTNLDTNSVTAGGVLTLTFSRAVSLVDETAIGANLTSATTAALNATSFPNSSVAAVLSTDGLTLTLTPQFAAAAAPVNYNGTNGTTADNGLMVNFTNVFVRINDASDNAVVFDVFGLVEETGNNPVATVRATADFN